MQDLKFNKDIRKQNILRENDNSIGNVNMTNVIVTTKNPDASLNSSKENSSTKDKKSSNIKAIGQVDTKESFTLSNLVYLLR